MSVEVLPQRKGQKEHVTPHLITPLIDNWHVDVVNEDGHLFPSGRSVGGAQAFVYVAFDGLLKHARQGGRGEV